jgi:hypothetical protein
MEKLILDDGTVLTILSRHQKGGGEEVQRRRQAMRAGKTVYSSTRPCKYHGIVQRHVGGNRCVRCVEEAAVDPTIGRHRAGR